MPRPSSRRRNAAPHQARPPFHRSPRPTPPRLAPSHRLGSQAERRQAADDAKKAAIQKKIAARDAKEAAQRAEADARLERQQQQQQQQQQQEEEEYDDDGGGGGREGYWESGPAGGQLEDEPPGHHQLAHPRVQASGARPSCGLPAIGGRGSASTHAFDADGGGADRHEADQEAALTPEQKDARRIDDYERAEAQRMMEYERAAAERMADYDNNGFGAPPPLPKARGKKVPPRQPPRRAEAHPPRDVATAPAELSPNSSQQSYQQQQHYHQRQQHHHQQQVLAGGFGAVASQRSQRSRESHWEPHRGDQLVDSQRADHHTPPVRGLSHDAWQDDDDYDGHGGYDGLAGGAGTTQAKLTPAELDALEYEAEMMELEKEGALPPELVAERQAMRAAQALAAGRTEAQQQHTTPGRQLSRPPLRRSTPFGSRSNPGTARASSRADGGGASRPPMARPPFDEQDYGDGDGYYESGEARTPYAHGTPAAYPRHPPRQASPLSPPSPPQPAQPPPQRRPPPPPQQQRQPPPQQQRRPPPVQNSPPGQRPPPVQNSPPGQRPPPVQNSPPGQRPQSVQGSSPPQPDSSSSPTHVEPSDKEVRMRQAAQRRQAAEEVRKAALVAKQAAKHGHGATVADAVDREGGGADGEASAPLEMSEKDKRAAQALQRRQAAEEARKAELLQRRQAKEEKREAPDGQHEVRRLEMLMEALPAGRAGDASRAGLKKQLQAAKAVAVREQRKREMAEREAKRASQVQRAPPTPPVPLEVEQAS